MDNTFDPTLDYVPFEKELVGFVDAAVEMASKLKINKSIQSENDWKVAEFIYKGWKTLYPTQSDEFEKHMSIIRAISVTNGVSREKGGATIQAQMEVPQRLYQMLGSFFPYQIWDKKFVREFSKRFPQLKSSNATL